ncbi:MULTISPECIES: MarR family winged helix-turn-helix transcriptional regulator [Paenibacillus]|uniref:MarR family transcriptional regulator n=1 Tax=Paenibacillus xylanilyticus TaxID=248903 RepID=A0A7Y6BUY3_9BACL|nr:MarR family transcriptional regulator [Paenibacillus xylanilyticus]NUU74434.1 MarR family transcriptional regulator [Paenibacillus xylanilyticus]
MSPHQENDAIGLLLSRTYFVHKKRVTHLLQDYGITPEQFGVLASLYKNEGITQKKLSELHGKDQTSVGKTLERLELKDLIIRSTDPVDRRAILLRLSEQGKELYLRVLPLMNDLDQSLIELITPEGADQLAILLNKIYKMISS